MLRRNGWILLLVMIASCLTSDAQHHSAGPKYGYSGADGPEAWGDLSPVYAACKQGHVQSPIDIRGAREQDLPHLEFHYRDVPLKIINNGHTVQVNYPTGSWMIVGDKKYELRQFHFHHPSEEHINGKAFDLTVHLVHSDSNGKLAVVAVLVESGSANEAARRVFDNLPQTPGQEHEIAGVIINARDFLPPRLGYYTFAGSLTTPPCTEGVTWIVLKTPAEVASDEVAAFAKLYPHNARPIQPIGGRSILESKF